MSLQQISVIYTSNPSAYLDSIAEKSEYKISVLLDDNIKTYWQSKHNKSTKYNFLTYSPITDIMANTSLVFDAISIMIKYIKNSRTLKQRYQLALQNLKSLLLDIYKLEKNNNRDEYISITANTINQHKDLIDNIKKSHIDSMPNNSGHVVMICDHISQLDNVIIALNNEAIKSVVLLIYCDTRVTVAYNEWKKRVNQIHHNCNIEVTDTQDHNNLPNDDCDSKKIMLREYQGGMNSIYDISTQITNTHGHNLVLMPQEDYCYRMATQLNDTIYTKVTMLCEEPYVRIISNLMLYIAQNDILALLELLRGQYIHHDQSKVYADTIDKYMRNGYLMQESAIKSYLFNDHLIDEKHWLYDFLSYANSEATLFEKIELMLDKYFSIKPHIMAMRYLKYIVNDNTQKGFIEIKNAWHYVVQHVSLKHESMWSLSPSMIIATENSGLYYNNIANVYWIHGNQHSENIHTMNIWMQILQCASVNIFSNNADKAILMQYIKNIYKHTVERHIESTDKSSKGSYTIQNINVDISTLPKKLNAHACAYLYLNPIFFWLKYIVKFQHSRKLSRHISNIYNIRKFIFKDIMTQKYPISPKEMIRKYSEKYHINAYDISDIKKYCAELSHFISDQKTSKPEYNEISIENIAVITNRHIASSHDNQITLYEYTGSVKKSFKNLHDIDNMSLFTEALILQEANHCNIDIVRVYLNKNFIYHETMSNIYQKESDSEQIQKCYNFLNEAINRHYIKSVPYFYKNTKYREYSQYDHLMRISMVSEAS